MTVYNAPLTEPVLALLQGQLLNLLYTAPVNAGQPIEEQYLLSRLGLKLQSETPLSDDLARFQQHFVLYHLLYRLQQQLLELKQSFLSIGLAKVQLLAVSDLPELAEQDGRRQYYMNWQNFYLMTEQLLEQHLEAFWQYVSKGGKASATLAHTEALALLQLADDFSLTELKKAYRKLAVKFHPDKNPGGGGSFSLLFRTLASSIA